MKKKRPTGERPVAGGLSETPLGPVKERVVAEAAPGPTCPAPAPAGAGLAGAAM